MKEDPVVNVHTKPFQILHDDSPVWFGVKQWRVIQRKRKGMWRSEVEVVGRGSSLQFKAKVMLSKVTSFKKGPTGRDWFDTPDL